MIGGMLRDHESDLEGANGKVFSSVERKLDPVTLETMAHWEWSSLSKLQKRSGFLGMLRFFFPSGMADDALRLGPYMRISCSQKRSQKRWYMDTLGRM
jgi:hypothetical protein